MEPHDPRIPCRDCGEAVHVVHPGKARTVVCAACGAQHDLSAAGAPLIDRVDLGRHRPEGLLDLGRSGRLGERVVQVVGRIRMAIVSGAVIRTWDEWVLITGDARYLRIREEEGHYTLLLPFVPERPVPEGAWGRMDVGGQVPFEGRGARVTDSLTAKVLAVEGELTSRVCVGDRLEVVELSTPEGRVLVERSLDRVDHFVEDPLEDRAMWKIFGYSGILRAFDALFRKRERNEALARGLAQGGMVLLGSALLGSLILLGVLAAATPVKEGWARFDTQVREPLVETTMGAAPLYPGWGFYTVEVECGVDHPTESVSIVAESPSGIRRTLARCVARGGVPETGSLEHSFRVDEGGPWRMVGVHRGAADEKAHAHVSWRLGWHVGSVWGPLTALGVLLVLGLAALGAWPFVRRVGLSPLEETFELKRAELALALRRRHHPPAAPAGAQPDAGGWEP